MSLRRIAGVAAAAVVASGAGLLLSSPTGAVTPPTPITLDASGMSSSSCAVPLGVYDSIALKPDTVVQFEPGTVLALGQSMTLSVLSEAQTTPAPTAKIYAVPASGVKLTFSSAGTYALDWKTNGVLGVAGFEQRGTLVIDSTAAGCKLGVRVPVASVTPSGVPSPITSAINGGLSSAASAANSLLNPVNGALPTIPPLPGLPSVPPLPGGQSPGASTPAGATIPGTTYKPHGPTVADRTVPDGYGTGSGVGGVYVPVSGNSINAGSQQSATGQGQQAGRPGGSSTSSAPVKSGGSPKTVELASNRPRSALGALPTLAVILAILALSGATAFYARTFLLQPAVARVKD